MRKERLIPHQSEIEKFLKILYFVGCSYAFLKLPFCAANSAIAVEVKEKANGRCDCCQKYVGYANLIASHMDHTRGNGYASDPDRLKAYCLYCEAQYHLDHLADPETIGMNYENNLHTIKSHWIQISKGDLRKALNFYNKNKKALLEVCGKTKRQKRDLEKWYKNALRKVSKKR